MRLQNWDLHGLWCHEARSKAKQDETMPKGIEVIGVRTLWDALEVAVIG